MKITEIRSMEIAELRKKLIELKRELMNFRFRIKMSQDNVIAGKISKVKKNVARIMMVMREQGYKY